MQGQGQLQLCVGDRTCEEPRGHQECEPAAPVSPCGLSTELRTAPRSWFSGPWACLHAGPSHEGQGCHCTFIASPGVHLTKK